MTEPGNTYSWSHSSAVYQIANGEDGDRTNSALSYIETELREGSEADLPALGGLLLDALWDRRKHTPEPTGDDGRIGRTPGDVAAHIADTVNAGSAFITAEAREDGPERFDVVTDKDGAFLVTVSRPE